MRISKACLVAILLVVIEAASAQSLPPPSRTVYKCEVAGKIAYSDAPCLGAQKVDVEPTRGLNKSSGAERIGANVRTERTNEAMADALRPVFDENAEQRTKRHRWAKLPAGTQAQCASLDAELSTAEAEERRILEGQARATLQQRLYRLRLRFAELKC